MFELLIVTDGTINQSLYYQSFDNVMINLDQLISNWGFKIQKLEYQPHLHPILIHVKVTLKNHQIITYLIKEITTSMAIH